MTIAEMEARLDELKEVVNEYDALSDILYLLDEGFITIDDEGGLYLSGDEPCILNVPKPKR